MAVPFKRVVFRLHWLLGLTAGVVLCLIGSTGALMAFKDECLQWLNPALEIPAAGRAPLSPDRWLEKVRTSHVEAAPAGFVWSGNEHAVEVRLAGRSPGGGQRVLLDPYTGDELPAQTGAAFFATVEQLHKNLAIGAVGKQIVGASTICVVLFGLSGLFLRWPARNKTSASTWLAVDGRLKGRGYLRQWHLILGSWVLVLHLVAMLSGLWFAYDFYRAGVSALVGAPAPQERRPRGEGGKPDAPIPAASLDAVWAAFLAQTPTATRAMVNFPREAQAPIEVRYLETDSPHPRAFSSASFFADGRPNGGKVYAELPRGQRFVAAMFPLHSGELFGLPGRIAMLLGALSMPFFAITGWVLWFWRRRLSAKSRVLPVRAPAIAEPTDLRDVPA